MKKKILSVFLAAIMMLSAIPVFAQTYTVVDGFSGATCQSYAQKVNNNQLMTGTIENNVWKVERTNTSTSTGVLGSVLTLPKEIEFSDGPFSIEFNLTDKSTAAVDLGVVGFSDGRNLTANSDNRITGVLYSNQYFGLMGTGTNKTNFTTNGGYSEGVETRALNTVYKVKMYFVPSENKVTLSIGDGAEQQEYDLSSKADYTKLSHMVVSFNDKKAGVIEISDLKITQAELDMQASVDGNAVKVAFDSAVDASTLNGVFTSNPACDIEVSYDEDSKIATLTGFDYGTAYTVTADVSKINAGKDGYLKRATAFSANVTTEDYVSAVEVNGFTGATCQSYAQKVNNNQLMTGTIENNVWKVERTNTSTSTGVLGSVLTLPKEIEFSDGPFSIEFNLTDKSTAAVDLGVVGFSDGRNLTANSDNRITGVLYSNQYFGLMGTGTNKTNFTTNGGYSEGVETRALNTVYKVKMYFVPSENKVALSIGDGAEREYDLSSKADYTKLSHMTVSFSDKKAGVIEISDLKITQESSAKVEDSTSSVCGKKPIEIKSSLLLNASTVTDTNVTVSDGANTVACDVALAKDKQTILVTPESEWVAGKEYTVTIAGVTVLNAPTKELAAIVTVDAVELISTLSATASGTDVTVSAVLNDSSFDGVIIAALYDAQDVLLGAVIVDTINSETITVAENTDLTNAKVKMFAWNSLSTMVPVIGAKDCSVSVN